MEAYDMVDILNSEQAHHVVAKAMRDQSFKQALLDHPNAVIESELGVTVPAGKTLHVVQAEAHTLSIVIPQRPAAWPADLSLEDTMARLLSDLPALDEKARKATDMHRQIIAKAWCDETFLQELLRDPKVSVARELTVALPDELNLQFLVEDGDRQYLILPLETQGMELTDEQLEAVAGGEVAVAVSLATGATVAMTVSFAVSASVATAVYGSW
jgi:hypothetical protein